MINVIFSFILELPLIGSCIYRVLHYLDNRSSNKAKSILLAAQTSSAQVITKNLLGEAITRLKTALKQQYSMEQLKNGSVKDLEIQDLVKGNRAKQAEVLNKAYVYHNTDLKTNVDRARMANKRIEDYRQLQDNTLQRQLIRDIRKTTDPIKKAELLKQFETKLKGNK
jgi:capsule polysaccharide export protein KpsC/LpsZ